MCAIESTERERERERKSIYSMQREQRSQCVPAYWQTKHTSGALCNSGGVPTVKPSSNSEAARCAAAAAAAACRKKLL